MDTHQKIMDTHHYFQDTLRSRLLTSVVQSKTETTGSVVFSWEYFGSWKKRKISSCFIPEYERPFCGPLQFYEFIFMVKKN